MFLPGRVCSSLDHQANPQLDRQTCDAQGRRLETPGSPRMKKDCLQKSYRSLRNCTTGFPTASWRCVVWGMFVSFPSPLHISPLQVPGLWFRSFRSLLWFPASGNGSVGLCLDARFGCQNLSSWPLGLCHFVCSWWGVRGHGHESRIVGRQLLVVQHSYEKHPFIVDVPV